MHYNLTLWTTCSKCAWHTEEWCVFLPHTAKSTGYERLWMMLGITLETYLSVCLTFYNVVPILLRDWAAYATYELAWKNRTYGDKHYTTNGHVCPIWLLSGEGFSWNAQGEDETRQVTNTFHILYHASLHDANIEEDATSGAHYQPKMLLP